VEYLKYFIDHSESNNEPVIHPLIHMDILGDGPTFRRSTLRVSGSIVFGAGIRNGVPTPILEDDRRWEELRNGRLEVSLIEENKARRILFQFGSEWSLRIANFQSNSAIL
jgi:hypothetical protein